MAPTSEGEIRNALRWLYGARPVTRKRQRRRLALNYRQRDAIAALLVRLTGVTKTMTPQAWIDAFTAYLATAGRMSLDDAAHEAALEADEQKYQFGPDASAWQSPAAAAHRVANELANNKPPSQEPESLDPIDDMGAADEPGDVPDDQEGAQ